MDVLARSYCVRCVRALYRRVSRQACDAVSASNKIIPMISCSCELLSGRRPWSDDLAPSEIQQRVCGRRGAAASRPALPPDLPPVLAYIITRGWSMAPMERQPMHEYRIILENILADAVSGSVDSSRWGVREELQWCGPAAARVQLIFDQIMDGADPHADSARVLEVCKALKKYAEFAAVHRRLETNEDPAIPTQGLFQVRQRRGESMDVHISHFCVAPVAARRSCACTWAIRKSRRWCCRTLHTSFPKRLRMTGILFRLGPRSSSHP